MKTITITIDDEGGVVCTDTLTDQDRLAIGNYLFDQEDSDNEGQVIFYTGIYEKQDE